LGVEAKVKAEVEKRREMGEERGQKEAGSHLTFII
jgi:hypothetical protein